ncbi:probable serine/threonine-protein kinase kinX isoform X4 [Perca fluviatilis]|uniref:probable serine/threonine-protein kinase kinX isoform X4 n=1 Tax=Perca fluviatilis TaxID=8168 RepID=UPI0019652672|nr:probable serine/threonine-protein kinase kinX isoform X4 [Perca fluviatilis]
MADSEHVSSTTPLYGDEMHHYQAEPDSELLGKPKQDLFSVDDIVDLVGGAQDALDRHLAEASAPHEFTEFTEASFAQEPVTLPEPVHVTEPKPVSVPEVKEPEPEPEVETETAIPDSTSFSFVPDTPTVLIAEAPQVVAPKVEPESTKIEPEPQAAAAAAAAPEPEPAAPKSDALPAAEPRKTAPAPAEAAEQPAVTEEPPAPASYVPSPSKAQPHPLMQFPTEPWDSPFLASQDNSKVSMDSFSKDTAPISSSGYEPDLHDNQSDEDDDLMYEVKKNNNPFEGYSPLADSGYSHFGDSKSDSRASKMSESPTPDLVQYGQTGESHDTPQSFSDDGKTFETGKMAPDSLMQSVNQFSSGLKDDDDEDYDEQEEDSALPPSLPDILKSSPLNPEKMDSGSSEGSPEQSPILERRMMESPNPPINLSANNPFAFDAKVSLLKEMTEELEVQGKGKVDDDDDKGFDAFDLVKGAEETAPSKVKEEEPVKIEQKDWFSSHDSPKMTKTFEPLDFQSKKTPTEDSDSESPTADSLSPVLEAMAKNPAIFQVETEKTDQKMEMEEPELAEEVSEHEVSSEEFEFIERPPRGVIDEFLEALDTSKFASSKPPEIPMDDDDDLSFGQQRDVAPFSAPPVTKVAPPPEVEEEAPSQSSYLLLTQASPQKSKAELEKLDIQQPAPPQAPLVYSPVRKPEEAAAEKGVGDATVVKIPNVNIRAGKIKLSRHGNHPSTSSSVFTGTSMIISIIFIFTLLFSSSFFFIFCQPTNQQPVFTLDPSLSP